MDKNYPALLGGSPARSSPNDGTLERDTSGEFSVPAFVTACQAQTDRWSGFSRRVGLPLGAGLPADLANAAGRQFRPQIATTLGAEHAALGAELAALHAGDLPVAIVPTLSGTQAISGVLAVLPVLAHSLGLRVPRRRDEVILPALSSRAIADAVMSAGLVPVAVDVDPHTLCLDAQQFEGAIGDLTVAVLADHLANRMAPVARLMEIAGRRGIAVIEGCAHAPGARWVDGDMPAGTIGHAGIFSFHGSSTLPWGAGGTVITRERALAMQIASVLSEEPDGAMPALTAATMRAGLRRFAAESAQRVRVVGRLNAIAEDLPGILPLPAQADVLVPPTDRWLFRVNLEWFAGMTLRLFAKALAAELRCSVAGIDELLRIKEPLRSSRPSPPQTAEMVLRSVLAVDGVAGLDDRLPDAFAVAVDKIHAHAARIIAQASA
jgi:dTDP-4-amino-4,6-dideoxygalactose transaminase